MNSLKPGFKHPILEKVRKDGAKFQGEKHPFCPKIFMVSQFVLHEISVCREESCPEFPVCFGSAPAIFSAETCPSKTGNSEQPILKASLRGLGLKYGLGGLERLREV